MLAYMEATKWTDFSRSPGVDRWFEVFKKEVLLYVCTMKEPLQQVVLDWVQGL